MSYLSKPTDLVYIQIMEIKKIIKTCLKKLLRRSDAKQKNMDSVQLNANINMAIEIHTCPKLYPCLICFKNGEAEQKAEQRAPSHQCPELYPCLMCLLQEDLSSVDKMCCYKRVEDLSTSDNSEKNENHEALRQFFARRGRQFVPKRC